MKFIFTADIHLKQWNDKEYTEDGLPLKLVEILNTIKQMCKYAKENDIDTVVIGGDLNDTKGIASVRAFLLFGNILKEYNDIKFYILHGNHDAVTGATVQEESAILLLSEHSNVETLINPYSLDNILFVPHSKNVMDVIRANYIPEQHEILISHFGLSEASLSTGISIRTSITASQLSMFKLVLLGHYHKPQDIENGDGTISYVGSPIAIRRDEAGEEKRFLVVDSDDCSVTAVPTDGYRKFYEFRIEESTDIKSMIADIEKVKKLGHHVVLKNATANLPKEMSKLAETVQVVDVYEADVDIRGITAAMTLEDQMHKFMEIKNVPKEDLEKYISIGMKGVAYTPEDF